MLPKDAVGTQTVVTLKWGDEFFTASGLMVHEKLFGSVYLQNGKALNNYRNLQRENRSSCREY